MIVEWLLFNFLKRDVFHIREIGSYKKLSLGSFLPSFHLELQLRDTTVLPVNLVGEAVEVEPQVNGLVPAFRNKVGVVVEVGSLLLLALIVLWPCHLLPAHDGLLPDLVWGSLFHFS